MSFYDDASLVFLAGGAAGKDGKAYSVKPVEELGEELVTNGTFDSDSDWTKSPSGATISGGKAVLTSSSDVYIFQDILTAGKTYRVQFDAEVTSGSFYVGENLQATKIYSVGSYTNEVFYFDVISSARFIFRRSSGSLNASIDNVSVREVISPAADFTFTRGTNLTATRVGKDGYIEKGRENLLLQSNNFGDDTTWDTSIDITATSGQPGYDGSNDAWLLKRSSNASRYIYQNLSASSSVYTLSFYGKPESEDWVYLYSFDGSSGITAYFDLQNEAVGVTSGSVISTNIEAAGNGYYRCSLTFNTSVTQVRIYPAVGDGSVTGGVTDAGIYIQDVQLEQGLVATDYIETGATTATAGLLEDEPRFDYSGGGCPALLMEPTRTNYLEQSEYFADTSWTKLNVDADASNIASPEGKSNSYKITETTANNYHAINVASASRPTLSAGSHTHSCFVKANGVNDIVFYNNGTSGAAGVDFDLSAESYSNLVNSATDASIESYGNGWYRISMTFTASAGTTSPTIYLRTLSTYAGDGVSGIYMYGMQTEAGSYPTSYMPNYGAAATVTRAKEYNECSFSGIGSQGTVFGEVEIKDDGVYGTPVALSDGDSTTNFILVYKQGDNKLSYRIRTGGVDQTSIASAVLAEGYHKFAFRFKENDCDFFVNGEIVDSDTSATMPTGLDSIRQYIGTDTNKFHGGTKQLLYFPTVLSNNDTEILTGATSYSSFATMATSSALNYTIYE